MGWNSASPEVLLCLEYPISFLVTQTFTWESILMRWNQHISRHILCRQWFANLQRWRHSIQDGIAAEVDRLNLSEANAPLKEACEHVKFTRHGFECLGVDFSTELSTQRFNFEKATLWDGIEKSD